MDTGTYSRVCGMCGVVWCAVCALYTCVYIGVPPPPMCVLNLHCVCVYVYVCACGIRGRAYTYMWDSVRHVGILNPPGGVGDRGEFAYI